MGEGERGEGEEDDGAGAGFEGFGHGDVGGAKLHEWDGQWPGGCGSCEEWNGRREWQRSCSSALLMSCITMCTLYIHIVSSIGPHRCVKAWYPPFYVERTLADAYIMLLPNPLPRGEAR